MFSLKMSEGGAAVSSRGPNEEPSMSSSVFEFQVNPSDVGIYDRVVIQELIKTVASSQQVDSFLARSVPF